MNESLNQNSTLSTKVKIIGTLFLMSQLLLAVNNYGPHNIPGLSLLFDEPWIPAEEISLQQAMYGRAANFTFKDITKTSGLNLFYRAKVNDINPSYLEVMSGGLAVGDVDGDGLDDVLLISIPSFEKNPEQEASPTSLYNNNGDGTFRNITNSGNLEM